MDDLINRQAALDAFDGAKVDEEYCNEYDIGYNDGIDFAVSKISVLPSAQPEQKVGEWIDDGQYGDNFPHHAWRCSGCGECVIEIDTPWFKFCPNCGAKMEGNK